MTSTVTYESLDDSTAQAGSWTPEATQANARKVAQDDGAAVYIGEFNSGASAVSIPILNEAGVPQISPANTAVGLTSDEPGARPGRAGQVLPLGQAHLYAHRPQGHDPGRRAGDADEGGRLHQGLHDQRQGGLRRRPRQQHPGRGRRPRAWRSSANERGRQGRRRTTARWRQGPPARTPTASSSRASPPTTRSSSTRTSPPALPDAKLYGPDGVAETGFTDPKEGGIPADVAARVKVTVATLSPDEYPPEGQEFFTPFRETYDEPNPNPYAIYGYEAMRLALDAIERSGTGEKADVLAALFETKDRASVLGTYSIDENGDTTLTDYGVYTIDGRRARVRPDDQGAGQ